MPLSCLVLSIPLLLLIHGILPMFLTLRNATEISNMLSSRNKAWPLPSMCRISLPKFWQTFGSPEVKFSHSQFLLFMCGDALWNSGVKFTLKRLINSWSHHIAVPPHHPSPISTFAFSTITPPHAHPFAHLEPLCCTLSSPLLPLSHRCPHCFPRHQPSPLFSPPIYLTLPSLLFLSPVPTLIAIRPVNPLIPTLTSLSMPTNPPLVSPLFASLHFFNTPNNR